MITRYYNCRLVKPDSVHNGELWVVNGKFAAPSETTDLEVDLEGMLVAPGFIDIQVNGGYGYDFTSDPDTIPLVAKRIPQTGVTAFCPTIVSSPQQVYENLPNLSSLNYEKGAAHVLGYHLEGPFINPVYRGAHNLSSIVDTSKNNAIFRNAYLNVPSTMLVTLAPEMDGVYPLMMDLIERGITVGLGHTGADEVCYDRSVSMGAKTVTHLFSAMKPFHHREPGIVGSVLTRKISYYSIILDKWHLHPFAVLLAWQTYPNGLILVSDAMAGMGVKDGEYVLGKDKVSVRDDKAVLSGTAALAGSVAGLDECVRRFHDITSCTISEAVAAVTLKPAALLGLYPQKGSLEVGADADFVVLDDHLNVRKTYVNR